jgi:hypothetical protein
MQFAQFAQLHSLMCSTQADNNSRKLQLGYGCHFTWCAVSTTSQTFPKISFSALSLKRFAIITGTNISTELRKEHSNLLRIIKVSCVILLLKLVYFLS